MLKKNLRIKEFFFKEMEKLGPYENKPHIAIAVSGGSDSMCLLMLANEWVKKKNGKITALVVNHKLRKESEAECYKLKNFFKINNIKNYFFEWKKNKKKNSIQERSRNFRYREFESWCYKNSVFHLLVGHHFDDQKETFLIRLNNNSNSYGLACMPKIIFKKKIRILRPMLNLKKEDILNYLIEKKINWFEDSSNNDSKYIRNNYRKALPKLEKEGLSDKILEKILDKAKRNRTQIEEKAVNWFVKNIEIDTLGFALINYNNLKKLDQNYFIFIITRIINLISGSVYPTKSKYIINFFNKLELKNNFKPFNLGGCHFFLLKEKLVICREILKNNKKNINSKFDCFYWDNRYEINVKKREKLLIKKEMGNTFFIEQLQLEGWKDIVSKRKIIKKKINIHNKIVLTLPAIKNKNNRVLSVPHLNYFMDLDNKKKFSNIHFIFKPVMALSNN